VSVAARARAGSSRPEALARRANLTFVRLTLRRTSEGVCAWHAMCAMSLNGPSCMGKRGVWCRQHAARAGSPGRRRSQSFERFAHLTFRRTSEGVCVPCNVCHVTERTRSCMGKEEPSVGSTRRMQARRV
jgi:hypothetical protein